MYSTKKYLSRRTFLRGTGVAIGLPLLDAMVPAWTALAQTAASPKPRMGCGHQVMKLLFSADTGRCRAMGVIEILCAAFRIVDLARGKMIPFEKCALVAQQAADDAGLLAGEGALGRCQLGARQRHQLQA